MHRLKSLLACVALCVLVAGCAGGPSRNSATPAEIDAYVSEASRKFDMPENWIREVIRQESGGRTMANGKPIVSKAGAMGLMQLMPGTYEEMRRKHGLGSDPFDPHDNIIAGTAYLREMYNQFGAPGFLGAYNCGPGCYGDYLAGNRSLPGETRRYIAAVGPRLNRTPGPDGSDIVLASAPAPAPAPAPVPVEAPVERTYDSVPQGTPVAPRSPIAVAALPPVTTARVVSPEPGPPAAPPILVAGPTPRMGGSSGSSGVWTVQLGAFRSPDDGVKVIDRARRSLPMLDRKQRIVQAVDTQTGPLYRARLSGLSQQEAAASCASLVGMGMACFVVPPGA